ncbi:3-(3-hydroxy-phenyl)propionate/3-hydroxycinnamic acid hydroxylase-like protein [Cladobotryum mycophilum]|uniref:3-(3-hydroxy-phenyl)propionate/3-hydroxycinnamic acid hydroxylase-like protein n=1 Tax=Cladobotryum mycophilum TaxID=491253 RepID=A0ABR0SV98_9HYPO
MANEVANQVAGDEWETTDVVICGCGPTGAMLSGYLGRMSVSNIVLEKEPTVTTDPRGIALDEEGLRLVQGLGVYEHVFRDIASFCGGRHYDLSTKPFMFMNYESTEGGTGHVGFICHKQPILEGYLRETMASLPHCELRSGSTVVRVSEDEEWVYCHYVDAEGREHKVRSRFLVGADGKTGFVRKNYLENRGITLQHIGNGYEEAWVALNWRISLPTPESHPDFPLWKLGHSPEDVFDLFFPKNFRFLCNPDRAAVCGRFGLAEDRLWRFELREDVHYPEDCIEVLRCRPFMFAARSCNKWAQDRVVLCGDAAHVFPPFGGQGIASGFRDTASLAWRLAVATRQKANKSRFDSLLTGWYTERKQQLDQSLASTIENGNFVCEGNPLKIFVRDWYLWAAQLIPSVRRSLHLGNRREGMVRYQYREGMPFIPELGGGVCLPQVYCRKLGSDDEAFFTDDVIWPERKIGNLFRLVVLVQDLKDVEASLAALDDIETVSGGQIQRKEVIILLEDPSLTGTALDTSVGLEWREKMYRVATGEEFAESPLCEGRPAPIGYDALRLGKEVNQKRYIFLRPDRFVFAACDSRGEIDRVATRIKELLGES